MTVHPGFSVATGGTIERFLREIATRIDPERVVELHVFPPIQQGGIESGVAVIAAEQIVPPAAAPAADATEPAEAQLESGAPADDESDPAAGEADEVIGDRPETVNDDATEAVIEASEPTADHAGAIGDAAAPRAPERLTIYTAHYRLVLKGPDRGKWDWGAVVDAEAPIEAVDAVVRGVQRRAGESFDAERIDGEAFRAALALASGASPAGTRAG